MLDTQSWLNDHPHDWSGKFQKNARPFPSKLFIRRKYLACECLKFVPFFVPDDDDDDKSQQYSRLHATFTKPKCHKVTKMGEK